MTAEDVRLSVEELPRCPRPSTHEQILVPIQQSVLLRAESLDDVDRLEYTVCGLCGGLLSIDG